jgi:sirohydrochlorin cobaltochelatase
VLLGHGTKDPEGVAEFLGYLEGVRQRTEVIVHAGALEYPGPELPDIQTAFDRAVADGATEVIGLPVLLFFAGHSREDMPEQVAHARLRHPGVLFSLAGPIGIDERVFSALEDRLQPFGQDERTAVLLVGRGALNSEANADLHKAARMLWDRNRYGWVEASFVSVAPVSVRQGIDRCARLGAERVVVIPYFLNTGVLVKRIAQQASHSQVKVEVAPHLGLHPLVFEILMDRLEKARSGICPCQSVMPCRISEYSCPNRMAFAVPA